MNAHKSFHKIYPCQTLHQRGLTLVEIMIGTVLSLILVGGVMKMFMGSKQTFKTEQAIAHIQENARIALDLIVRDISSGGYMGCLDTVGGTNITNTLNDTSVNYNFANAIDGTDGSGSPDTLFIRRVSEGSAIPMTAPMTARNSTSIQVDSTHPNYGRLAQWDIVTLSDCSDAVVFMITNVPTSTGPNAGVLLHENKADSGDGVVVPIDTNDSYQNDGQFNLTSDFGRIFGATNGSAAKLYFVGTTQYDVRPSTSGTTSSLFVNGREFIEGVEDFQVTYGENATPTANAPTLAGVYVIADNVTNWNNVISIRVALTLVSLERATNSGDGLLRKIFTSTIRMRNRAPS